MSSGLAKYACDECRDRKIRCSREAEGCSQCKSDDRHCIYSRSGVIRRRPRQTKRSPAASTNSVGHAASTDPSDVASPGGDLRSQMDYDITEAQDRVREYGNFQHDASSTLAQLDEEYSSFWQGPSLREMAKALDMTQKRFIAFDEASAQRFAPVCAEVQRRGKPLFSPTSPDLLRNVLQEPNGVPEKAHLVLVYGILLTEACLDTSYDPMIATKFRWNLRLAMDDARLLLEPSDLHIEVLTLLALHVQEVSTPSMCWMLVSTACRMLQILGINPRGLDQDTRNRRMQLFWILNTLDKELALVFGRPPTLQGAMYANIPHIPIQELLNYQPHVSADEQNSDTVFTSMFGAHFIRQIHSSAAVLSDIWSYLYANASHVNEVRKTLDDWFQQSTSVLNACLLSEESFLNAAALHSMRLGIKSVEFHYYYLKVLVLRSKTTFKNECVTLSRQSLFLLADLVSDSSEVFNGVIWVLLYCPFTPFFILFGEILSSGNSSSNRRSLEAMESLPRFLEQMRTRHPQASKLHTIATTFVNYARSALTKRSRKGEHDEPANKKAKTDDSTITTLENGAAAAPSMQEDVVQDMKTLSTEQLQDTQPLLDFFSDPAVRDLSLDMNFWCPNSQGFGDYSDPMAGMEQMLQARGPEDDPYGFFADTTIDWFSWDANAGDPSFGMSM